MLVQDPNASHANPYACPGSQRFTHKTLCCKSLCHSSLLTMPTIPYNCPGSQFFTRKLLTLVQVPDNSSNSLFQGSLPTAPTLPYAGAGSQCFTCKSLRLCRFPPIQTIAYARAGFQQFTCKSLRLYRFLKLHMHILTLVQVPKNSNNSLCQGSLPTALTLPYVPEASHAHPYACTGSRQFRPLLTPGKPPDNSKNSFHN
ncbi:hypothetical protein O181_073955 [Austropuccinia psidii MF-1]|uniref:Uncharacterized protein n=1 Tax=Austropuccinia psidii MF-1 TaxID=1389203 RepID=A0A9Q3F3L5_9BASI|nr:hypothetical protein [Austropuccinia psidii MF-1]